MAQKLEVIETERLLLRGINETDADLIVKWRSDPKVYRFFKLPHQITMDEHLNWYRNIYLLNESRYDWMCIEKKSNNRIGVFGLYVEQEQAEINYLLASDAQHKGYASEAIQFLITYALESLKCKSVIAEIHEDNKPSINLVKKLNFSLISREGDFVVYRIED